MHQFTRVVMLAFLSLVLYTSSAVAMEKPNHLMGEQLFKASDLGSNGKSCASCHPAGKGLQEISAYDDGMLKEMINFCIRDAQKGMMLPIDSQEIESIFLYLRNLSGK